MYRPLALHVTMETEQFESWACLQVGSTVEVKTNEGLSSEAVIGKLTDASLYTVGELVLLTRPGRVTRKRATV